MIKKSIYNIRIPAGNIIVYYNSFTDQFIALSHPIDALFNNVKWEKTFEVAYPTHFSKLKELGFIIDSNRDELSEIRFQNKQKAFNSREHFMMV